MYEEGGIYRCAGFSQGALAAFSGREFDGSRACSAFLKVLGCDPARFCLVQQVHGEHIVVATEPFEDVTGDGLVSAAKNLALMIRTADCAPVFFFDPKTPAVGVCHVGWRGARREVVGRLVDSMRREFGSDPNSIEVAIGPAIREECYEVGPEFERYFKGWVREEGPRRFFNLVGLIRDQLIRAGIQEGHLWDSGFCTACRVDRFFSARREGPDTGRLISTIMLE